MKSRHTEKQLHAELAKYLLERGLTTTPLPHVNGDILETKGKTEDEFGLMIHVEVYNQADGTHQTVPLDETIQTINNWNSD